MAQVRTSEAFFKRSPMRAVQRFFKGETPTTDHCGGGLILRALALFALATLCGCGFHLRTLSAEVDGSVYVQGQSGTEDFAHALERALDTYQVTRSRDPTTADWILHLQRMSESRRTVSVTEDVYALEYQIATEVQFRVLDASAEERVPSSRVRAERIYVFDRDNLLGAAEEEAALRRDMQAELVSRILRVLETASRDSSA